MTNNEEREKGWNSGGRDRGVRGQGEERHKKCVCVCVCVRERERESGRWGDIEGESVRFEACQGKV
jgi:hypothetical protein